MQAMLPSRASSPAALQILDRGHTEAGKQGGKLCIRKTFKSENVITLAWLDSASDVYNGNFKHPG